MRRDTPAATAAPPWRCDRFNSQDHRIMSPSDPMLPPTTPGPEIPPMPPGPDSPAPGPSPLPPAPTPGPELPVQNPPPNREMPPPQA
ncbi:hypothetical protein CKO45_11950 [Paracraurococcus ruber]|uniref:Uncharacterized protein n=2 Tax=Paracraurococcus ruber TaxID=77675 RepID=A0ABS1CWP8_9PROT|nr:hypothetical protein [Paracraurococcus ruber]